jgi:hypothetical protein
MRVELTPFVLNQTPLCALEPFLIDVLSKKFDAQPYITMNTEESIKSDHMNCMRFAAGMGRVLDYKIPKDFSYNGAKEYIHILNTRFAAEIENGSIDKRWTMTLDTEETELADNAHEYMTFIEIAAKKKSNQPQEN